MKLSFFIILMFGLIPLSIAQKEVGDTTVYRKVDKQAEFPGGPERMQEFIQSRLKGDQSTWDLKEGDISIECIIEANGRIRVVNILKSLDPTFDQNFANLFRSMPKWAPAMIGGKPVRSYFKYTTSMNYYMR